MKFHSIDGMKISFCHSIKDGSIFSSNLKRHGINRYYWYLHVCTQVVPKCGWGAPVGGVCDSGTLSLLE